MYKYLIMLAIFIATNLFASAPPDTAWTRIYGNGCGWGRSCVQQTTDGGYIVTGMIDKGDYYREDVYLVRTDSNGNTLWTKAYGGTYHEVGNSVKQTQDGGFIIAGVSDYDGYLIRTNANGGVLWNRFYDGSQCSEVQQTSDGGYIIAAGKLIKTDLNGNTLWTKPYGGYSVQECTEGGFIIAGTNLIRTDVNGDTLWTKTYGGYSVRECTDRGFIIAGTNLIRTDKNGDTLWTKDCGGDCRSVEQTSDGGFIIAGQAIVVGTRLLLVKLKPETGIEEGYRMQETEDRLAIAPNPSGKKADIRYWIPDTGGKIADVKIQVYDVGGRRVEILAQGKREPGNYSVDFMGKSGIYFVELMAGSYKTTKKLILL